MSLNDANLTTHSSNHLDLAFVSFFEQFRKIYVGDSIQKNSQVFIEDVNAMVTDTLLGISSIG